MEDRISIRNASAASFASLATNALDSRFTDEQFVQNDRLFAEICARWIQTGDQTEAKTAAFGRILPLAPHLAEHVERFLGSVSLSPIIGPQTSTSSRSIARAISESDLCEALLGIFRLLSFDCRSFAKYIRLQALESLLHHASRRIRYLAVRTFCLHVHAADHATQGMIKRSVGEGEIRGKWEGKNIDYRFLSLWEEKRWRDLDSRLRKAQEDPACSATLLHQQLSPYTVNVGGVLLPRLDGATSQEDPAKVIPTPTTETNLKNFAQALLSSSPLLLTGLAGSGKTLLTRHFAWQLNKLESMVTLHLNEQSDAKLLIGMYATGAKPGTFSWRPGVLTTAVKEGRWIFIEDLDRAPNEVISTLLPLIERRELLIPSRGETVRAARGFRIIATIRSSLNPRGQEIAPRQNMIGHRFWNSITVQAPCLSELEHIVSLKHPVLGKHVTGIMRVYARLLELFSDATFSSENGTSLRALTPRDLLKWCGRIARLLEQSSTFNSAQMDDIFMEAYDCFAGSLRSERARERVMERVAQELHIDIQRRDHLLRSRELKLEVPTKSTSSGPIRIGRVRLLRHKSSKRQISGRPFSTNDHTLRLLEKVAVAVDRQEPLLLVGETGTGKTTCIQYLAEQLGRKLVAFNLSQQSESGDLLGGYKPVNVRSLVIPLKDEFDELFDATFSRKKNPRFMEALGKRVAKGEWKRVCILWREAVKMVDAARKAHESQTSSPDPDSGQPKKKRKVDSLPADYPKARWDKFAVDLYDLEAQLANGSEAFAFSFLEGNIVKAVRNGDWVLLDEINLASSDTLEALADLLGSGPDGSPSILLTETGNVERVVAHPNFRVFAAMNPATDVGKKDLPPGIRSRFTEFYVESPDSDSKSLQNIVERYLGGEPTYPAIVRVAVDVTNLYLRIQELGRANMLVDGADQKAHFSLRTLTRTLSYAREIAPLCSLRRALFEGFHMSFLTFLGKESEDLVAPLIKEYLFPQKSIMKAELGKPLLQPSDGREYVRQGHYWLRQGAFTVEEQPHYIITPFVLRNMNNLIRAASTRRYPVLIQGPTSSGKTSMIEYLAKRSGNKFVRINNHEHTDLQEYLGSYISGADGKLTFQEGILVKALREGHWIVLDELNLAPTDVLEALNRLLDDNRELLIPETQEVVRPHEDFMLFATQNPAGLYGGRKVLSRAFRNRFLELHFDDIPVEELNVILHRRTMIPESWCKRIVKVYQELSTLRQESRIFEQKSFATLRDLFRWAQRKADTIQDLANNGYMLLAERVRKEDERIAVKKVIERVMSEKGPRVSVDEEQMYSEDLSPEIKICNEKNGAKGDVVWTRAMRRLFVLVAHAIRNKEPVLLVGETGCGKTTVCQMLADAFEKQLHILNAHQNTETGDLIGAQRPIRNRAAIEDLLRRQLESILMDIPSDVAASSLELPQLLELYDKLDQPAKDAIPISHREEIQANRIKSAALFEWADGSLVHAMRSGQYFLLDEISLADDSVLERLNSVLESSRTLLLAEKGPIDSLVTASEDFQFLATMNPGGDYGKKELSPALRNRFTEIWVPALSDMKDILQIVQSKLKPAASQYAGCIVSFSQWFNENYNTSVASSISIRDTLAWVTFINNSVGEDALFALVHGAAMVFIDTLGANPAGLLAISSSSIDEERTKCLHRLSKLLGTEVTPLYFGPIDVISTEQSLSLGVFSIPKFSQTAAADVSFSLDAPTTRSNAMRVVRALQLSKPILLEGNPGVGKTTLITALAKAIGKPLTRLNLSEQTDLMDLFGSDVPVEGGQAGTFAWRDAPFLEAMKNGDWVLLDEMNLASQSVLEGLNAVLDHRGEVYISELDQTFHKRADFRVFAAQNPHHQGGGRKGLPASFVNRFTVVYADVFRPEDLSLICSQVFPDIEKDQVKKMISFVAELDEQVVQRRSFAALGAPWEFNLRDTLRWLQLLASQAFSPRDFLDTIFAQRFRTETDRARLLTLFETIYGAHEPRMTLYHNLSPDTIQTGLGVLPRDLAFAYPSTVSSLRVDQLAPMEALIVSVQQNWPVILVGPPGSGKTSILNQLASLVGASLVTFSMNADIDAMDLVGGYEQVDPSRELHRFVIKLDDFVRRELALSETPPQNIIKILEFISSESELSKSLPALLDLLVLQDERSTELPDLAQQLRRLLEIPQQIDGARFQWVDGILIQALEQGKWLILDNANLCSSAVLDRLNSLLEPNGYLSINEHSTADGKARIVKPHPDFRIFMTMDPRFGELSRAMRNRAVEICLLVGEEDIGQEVRLPEYPLDSQMYRFRHVCGEETGIRDLICAKLDNLSIIDADLLQSFSDQASKGLLSLHTHKLSNDLDSFTSLEAEGDNASQDNILQALSAHVEMLVKIWDPEAKALQRYVKDEGYASALQTLPYHPLSNELCVHSGASLKSLSIWYDSLYEVLLDLYVMQQAIQSLPSTKFERRKEKQKLPGFLYTLWRSMNDEVKKAVSAARAGQGFWAEKSFLKALRQFFWAFHELAAGLDFNRASFQTYLKMLTSEVLSMDDGSIALSGSLKTSLMKGIALFGSEVQLTTGLGMERIWRSFKPNTPKTWDQLLAILALEGLADRLDAAMWKSNLKLDEMIQIRERFASSLELVRKQEVEASELITNLEIAVLELERNIGKEDVAITPYFENEFEGLCQFLDVAHSHVPSTDPRLTSTSAALPLIRAKASLLARRSTKTLAPGKEDDHIASFTRIYRYAGLEKTLIQDLVLRECFHAALLSKLQGADEVQLLQLDRFETELQVLSQQLALDSERITQDQYDALPQLYRAIFKGLFSSHCVDVISAIDADGLEIYPGARISEAYSNALAPLEKCYRYVNSSKDIDSQAWVTLGLTGLALYVPNYPHDPALQPMVELKLFNKERSGLLSKLQTLRQFQLGFTGQYTSFRTRQIENTIQQMGDEPPAPAIVRPKTSELDALQGDFTNLLSILRPLISGNMTIEDASHDMTLRQNIERIIRRLEGGYRSYDDITSPAIGFLVCLHIGLALGATEREEQTDISRSLAYVTHQTPFFGLHSLYDKPSSGVLMQFCEEQLAQNNRAIDLRWHALHCLSIIKTVDPGYLAQPKSRELLHDIFSSYYSEWKTKLLQDQKEQAKNTSLYTFRGDEEEPDDEDPELFPDYEQDDISQGLLSSTTREHALRLTDIHADIFLGGTNASNSIKALLEWCSTEMNRVAEGNSHGTKHENALPAIYLTLQKKADALVTSGAGKDYNFYFDANLPEAKRLITLIHRVQYRFRQIRDVWPEHATLWDVLRTCQETLEFRHVDPVAKFITKVEKLHAYVYEWQRVASKEFSTASLYDELTKLLVSWRQLELTTWAKLFDIETQKCQDEAKNWFFIAYETVIAAADSVEDDREMRSFAKELLKTLESFLSNTTLGQYEQRIALLRQVHCHVLMRMKDDHKFESICSALENFIAYFSRLRQPVKEALIKGRQSLEKEVNNVIKLASWKDTNIEALKQSAKTSHRKLTKLVRKFRKLLNQSVSGIIKTGFAEESSILSDAHLEEVGTAVAPTALEVCATTIPGWNERPGRFKNLAVTVSMIRTMSIPKTDTVDGATYIESFIADFETSVVQLQKATPTTLTEDNKESVQHLKTRKRKLYADTMKELRQMGVKSNLSSDILAKQDELSTVLSRLPVVDTNDFRYSRGAECFLHKTLSIMGQVRDVSKEHSGDLTSNDVARSVGFLEGLLHATIRQRSTLRTASQAFKDFQVPVAKIASLCRLPQPYNAIRVSDTQVKVTADLQPNILWLCAMVDTGADVVAAQVKLGKINEENELARNMREWSGQLRAQVDMLNGLSDLPRNIWSDAHREFDETLRIQLSSFHETFNGWIEQFPMSRTVLKHIQPYVLDYPKIQVNDVPEDTRIRVETYSNDVLATLDMILGAIQDLENALKDLPASTDDTSWLVKEEQTLSAAINALHVPQITIAFERILDKMRCVEDDTERRAITALFATIQPILKQYASCHKYIVERFDATHCASTKLLHRLAKSFIQVGAQGFCQPPEKSADQQPGKDEKLEAGTGLGEGEGAEDISKDIEEDEDLEDLAQEKGGEREGSIEEEDDAVDMGEQEMEGETGEVAEKEDQGSDAEDGDEDAQSEMGSVDDLGPSAVDEKMWDEGGKDDDLKEKEGEQDAGTENKDEQVAAEQKEKSGDDDAKNDDKEGGQEDEEMEMEGEDQEENVDVGETEQMDPHAKEEETLDLPDELNIDGNDDEKEDDDFGDMDMGDELPEEEMDADPQMEPDAVDGDIGPEQDDEDKDTTGHAEEEDTTEQQEEGDEPMDDDDAVPLPDQNAPEDEVREMKDDHQADLNADAGAGAEANEESHKNQQEQASASAANQEDGTEGESSENKQETTAEDGELGQSAQPDAGGRGEQSEESPETQSFKKLGDVLERWYNQQEQISEPQQRDETQMQQIDKEVDMANADFEHLPDDETKADTQALGTATEEQAKALDHDMAMAVEEDEKMAARPEDNDNELQEEPQDVDMQDAEPPQDQEQQQPPTTDGRPQAFVGEQKPFHHSEDADMDDAMRSNEDMSDSSSVVSVETKLDLTHLDANAMDAESARTLWLSHESSTHSLSQQLTEHLRLILAPTLATKLRGDFRTGKRLNLKRIIPYIASGYKRDKIWLRRSMPSKRSYQVMIALDDSKSMSDSGAVELALKTLTLVTRSLSMLEVGEVSVVGFGDQVNVAHEFDKPFTSESGVRVFEQFGFEAGKTDVRGLVNESLELFAEARRKGSSSAGEDLWQLMLIVSDGICDSHAEIQRLIRRAQEERVMIVFIIIDSSSSPPPPAPSQGETTDKKANEKTSIMDLQSVEIKNDKVVRWKYMERFPFRYYLVVRDVRELPGVLSGALRQWFGEVVGTS